MHGARNLSTIQNEKRKIPILEGLVRVNGVQHYGYLYHDVMCFASERFASPSVEMEFSPQMEVKATSNSMTVTTPRCTLVLTSPDVNVFESWQRFVETQCAKGHAQPLLRRLSRKQAGFGHRKRQSRTDFKEHLQTHARTRLRPSSGDSTLAHHAQRVRRRGVWNDRSNQQRRRP